MDRTTDMAQSERHGQAPPPDEGLHPDQQPRDMVSLCFDLWQDSLKSNEKRFKRQRQELDFALKHQHYTNEMPGERSQVVVKPHTTKLFHLLRHKWSEASSQPIYIEARPQNPGQDDPQLAEDAKLAIESVTVNDPSKLYTRLRRRWIIGALAARSWVMAMDYDWNTGRETFRLVPPWYFHRAPGFPEMHDPSCPWVCEESHPRLQEIRGAYGWQNVNLVKSDAQCEYEERTENKDYEKSDQETATVLKFLFRFDSQTTTQEVPYMECPSCGFLSSGHLETESLCPKCMNAILSPEVDTQTVPRFPDGRMVIVAPHSQVVLYDGEWVCPLRSFPYMELRAYEHPIDPMGISDTVLHWDNVVLLNSTKRYGWDQIRKGAGIFMFPDQGLLNAQRQPFEYSDIHGQIAYWTDIAKAKQVQYFPGPQLNQGVVTMHQLIADDFQAGSGIADLSLGEEDTRDIPVGTIRTMERMGNVPLRDFVAVLREEESIGFSVLLDMLVHTWGPERAVEYLGEDGYWRIKNLQGAALTSMKVVVHAAPDFSTMKAEEMENILRWAQLAQMNPAMALIVAERNNLPMSVVQRIMTAPLPQFPGAGSPPPGPGGGPPLPPAIAARMNGGGPLPMNGGE